MATQNQELIPEEAVLYFRNNYVKENLDSLHKIFIELRDMGFLPLRMSFLLMQELGISFRLANELIQASSVWDVEDTLWLIAEENWD